MCADATDESAKVLVLLVNAERLNETASEVSCNRERQVRQPLGTMQAKFLEATEHEKGIHKQSQVCYIPYV